MANKIYETSLPGLLRIEPITPLSENETILSEEVVDLEALQKYTGQPFEIRQINHSNSIKNVMRGLHAEKWEKIVWVPRGRVLSAMVDIRVDSPTFGQYELVELSEYNRRVLYIPVGFANSIYAITESDYIYLVSKLYDGQDTFAVAWDDPDLAIPWPNVAPIISKRDLNNPYLRDLFPEKFANEGKKFGK
jgi:dTDP-4-dehydrorhamnose 3,5-epimerase